MNKNVIRGIVAVAGLASASGVVMGQAAAPLTAQRFEIQYLVERFDLGGNLIDQGTTTQFYNGSSAAAAGNLVKVGGGTFQSDVSVGRVDITQRGRSGIVSNTTNTNNLGISRLGGAGGATSGFRIVFTDSVSAGKSASQGTLSRAVSSGTAIGGVPSTGLFKEFRGVLTGWSAAANANNTDTNNGNFSTNNTAAGTGPVSVFNASGGRTLNFGDGPGGDLTDDNVDGAGATARTGGVVGVGTLAADGLSFTGGEFANYYKISYVPREDLTPQGFRSISVTAFGASARYLSTYNGNGNAGNGSSATFSDQTFTFFVPTPGAAAVLGLGGMMIARRRRA